mgnify:FL=1
MNIACPSNSSGTRSDFGKTRAVSSMSGKDSGTGRVPGEHAHNTPKLVSRARMLHSSQVRLVVAVVVVHPQRTGGQAFRKILPVSSLPYNVKDFVRSEKRLGTGPVKSLLLRNTMFRDGRFDSSDGIRPEKINVYFSERKPPLHRPQVCNVPDNSFEYAINACKFDMLASSDGMVPDRKLLATLKDFRFSSWPNSVGMWPLSEYPKQKLIAQSAHDHSNWAATNTTPVKPLPESTSSSSCLS